MMIRYIRSTTLLLLVALTAVSCNRYFFKPLKGEYYHPGEFGLIVEDIFFNSPDGEQLHGWFMPAAVQAARGTVLHLHGNSANMTDYLLYVAFLVDAGYNLMMFDYRGFGKSGGEPSAEGVVRDAKAALDYLRHRPEVKKNGIIIYGQSLGAAVAISLVGGGEKEGVAAVIAEAPFASYRQIAEMKMQEVAVLGWFSGIASRLLIDDRYSPIRFVQHVAPVPLLIAHGTDDRIVPFSDGLQLFERASEPRLFWRIEEGRHIQMLSKFRSIYRPRLLAYLQNLNPVSEELPTTDAGYDAWN